jgi:hypothetical protein
VILSNGLTLWEIGESHILNRQLETKSLSNRFELYFETEDIDGTFELLNNASQPQ